jgi:drug/metabolite transporter (DMT)-like permease
MTRLTADLLLLGSAAIWGLAFVFQKTAMQELGPLTFIAARSAIAALVLVPVAVFEARQAAGGRPVDGVGLARIALWAGLAFFAGAALQQIGLVTATVTNAGFLTALYVVFVPILMWIWFREAPARIVWPAAAVSFAGTWLLGGGTVGALSRGDVLIAVCAVFWAVHVLVCRASAPFGRPVLFTCLQFVVVAALAALGAAASEAVTVEKLWRAAPQIAFVGILSSAVTFTILTIALRHTPPSEASIIISSESLFAALAGAILLGERLTPIAWAGAALIVAATLAVQVAGQRTAKPVSQASA